VGAQQQPVCRGQVREPAGLARAMHCCTRRAEVLQSRLVLVWMVLVGTAHADPTFAIDGATKLDVLLDNE